MKITVIRREKTLKPHIDNETYFGHTLKKSNDTSHDCGSDQLNPISCICRHILKGLTNDPLTCIGQFIDEHNSEAQLSVTKFLHTKQD